MGCNMNRASRYLRHRFTDAAKRQEPHRQYELFKEMWRVNHPEATPEQYSAAMQEIARKLGI